MSFGSKPRGGGSAWTEEATLTLIGFYDENKHRFMKADRQAEKILWMKAARKVTLTGLFFSIYINVRIYIYINYFIFLYLTYHFIII